MIRSVKKDYLVTAAFLLYLFAVIWITLLRRSPSYHTAHTELFWSYRKWFSGDTELGREIIANIILYIPFGFLLKGQLKLKRSLWFVLVSAAAFSLVVETLQLVLLLGVFETDDLFSNTLGSLAGGMLYTVFKKCGISKLHLSLLITLTIPFCAGLLLYRSGSSEENNTARAYCFQVDEVNVSNGVLSLEGFAFMYEQETAPVVIYLRSLHSGKLIKLSTVQTLRSDVNEYFLCDYDYSFTGFRSETDAADANEEYEIVIRWPFTLKLATGVYLTGERVHYQPDDSIEIPSGGRDLEKIVNSGTLRLYRPDYHCWIYQMESELYWIVDSNYHFEDDGKTYIQYQLWTTQINNLPEQRLRNNCFWDNIGGYFEEYEIEGDFGPYRIMKRGLPSDYSVITIETGYYKNGEWIWRSYFRPIYDFYVR